MDAQPSALRATDTRHRHSITATRQGVISRLADPYLTDHDRWVLGQFASFLSGRTPDPDPRAVREQPRTVLYSRVRRATL